MSVLLSRRFRRVREEWAANPRLRWGAVAIVGIIFVYAVLVLMDWRSSLQETYRERSLQLYKVAALAGQDEWILRADSAKAVQKSLQAEIPAVGSIGLAQADAQSRVRQVLNAFGPKLSAEARPPAQVAGQPGVWRLPVSIRGPVTQAQLVGILWRIESSDRLMVIDEVTITFVERVPNVAMTTTAYYRVAAPAGGANARP